MTLTSLHPLELGTAGGGQALSGWLLALAALCLAELTPFPLSLAGKNKLFPSLGALDPHPPQPCPHSPQSLQQYLLCRLPGLLITSLGVMESGFP